MTVAILLWTFYHKRVLIHLTHVHTVQSLVDSNSVQIYAKQIVLESLAVVDLHSKILDARPPSPPGGPNSFNFMQFLGKFGLFSARSPYKSD